MSFTEEFVSYDIPAIASYGEQQSFFAKIFSDLPNARYTLLSVDGSSTFCVRPSYHNNEHAGLYLLIPLAQAKRYPVYGGRLMFRKDYGITNQKTWFGFHKNLASDPPNSQDDFYGFFLDNTSGGASWQWIYRANNGAINDTGDTGFKAQKEFWYDFEVALTPKEATYTLNGKVVGRNKRDAFDVDLNWMVLTQNTHEGDSKEMFLDLLYGSQER